MRLLKFPKRSKELGGALVYYCPICQSPSIIKNWCPKHGSYGVKKRRKK